MKTHSATNTGGKGVDYFCTICNKRGHTATHHTLFPDIYDNPEDNT